MFEHFWLDSLLIFILIFVVVLSILIIRARLLKLWHKVSRLEIVFHNELKTCMEMIIKYEAVIEPYDPEDYLKQLKTLHNKHMRVLDHEQKRMIHRSIQTLIVVLDESNVSAYTTLKSCFDTLESARLKYNSAVIYYNHVIRAFPIRFLANRLNLHMKQYFG